MSKKFKKLLAFTAIAAFSLYKYNEYISKLVDATNPDANSEENYYNWKFGKIRYKVKGTGDPILLVHALSPESSMKEWSFIEDKLAETHKIYELDLLGCGNSDKPSLTYSNFLYVKLLNDFIKDIIGEKADIVATTSSTPVVISAMTYEKSLYKKVIFLNPAGIELETVLPDAISSISAILLRLPIIGKSIYNVLMSKKVLQWQLKDRIENKDCPRVAEYLESCYAVAHAGKSEGRFLLANITDKLMSFNIEHCLNTITSDIKLIIGAECSVANATVDLFTEKISSVSTTVIENTGTLPQIEAPNKVAEEILTFIS